MKELLEKEGKTAGKKQLINKEGAIKSWLKLCQRNDLRQRRHARVRTKISGTPECPRLKRVPFKCSYSCASY